MSATSLDGVLLEGDHASRPAAGDVAKGALYSCSDHDLVYQSDLSTWSTWATLGTAFDGTMAEIATPSTPSSGNARIYPKADGRFYSIDDAGTEYGPFDAGGGGGGTDYIATIAAEANLLYYHPMNETSGTSFHDELGGTALAGTTGGNEVAVDGPPLQGDVLGGSVGFNSSFQKVSKAAITWPAQWTWEVWAFFLFNPANGIFGQWDGSGSMFFINGASDTRVYCGGSSPSWNATNAEIRGRHHILMGYDGTNVHLYWDGVQKINSACSNNSTNVGSAYQLGGVNGGGNGNGFVLSDSAFYDDFDSGRAAAHYALGHP